MPKKENMYIANLAFLLNYTTGETNDEIESEIFKAAFQKKGSVHGDRAYGGGFQDIEQEPESEVAFLIFGANLVEAIYIVNAEKGFDPYIVVGFADISSEKENDENIINVNYRLLKDLTKSGVVTF